MLLSIILQPYLYEGESKLFNFDSPSYMYISLIYVF